MAEVGGPGVVGGEHPSSDVGDRVLLEAELDAARRRRHEALDASPDGFAIYQAERDADGLVTALRLTFINAAGAAGFAGDASLLLGRDLRDFYPEAVSNGLWADMVTALATGQAQHSRVEGQGPSWAGSIHGIQSRLDADTVVSTWRDVSDQVRTERALADAHAEAAAARATLDTALEATSDGFMVLDLVRDEHRAAGLRLVTCNTAAVARAGLTPEQVRGRDLREFSSSCEKSGLWDHVLAAIAAGRPRNVRVHIDGADGQWFASYEHTIAPAGAHRVVLTYREVTADERARRELIASRHVAEHRASHDALTGLPNRDLLLRRLQQALDECLPDELVAVVFCDLNDFKAVNDTYGHSAGDAVLTATAVRLRDMIRPQDTAARLAGDEFVVVLRRLPPSWDHAQFMDRATSNLGQPVVVGDTLLAPAASLGHHLADPHRRPETDRDPATVLARADESMYEAKRAFRARRRV